jgi:hypothetical protein
VLAGVIIGCEIAFWVVLGAGLVLRYPLGRPQLGALFLWLAPLVDLILLVVAAIALVGDADTSRLRGWIGRLTATLAIWFFIALSYTIWPKPEPVAKLERTQ